MNLPQYSSYKPSKIEWAGEIPAHWNEKRLRFVAVRSDEKVEADPENPIQYVGMEHIESWTGKVLPLDLELVPSGISNRFRRGDVLFGKLRPYLAKASILDFDGLCSSELVVLRTYNHDKKYLLYQLLSEGFISVVDSSTYGAKMPRASWEFIGACFLPCPNIDEQRAIADFLDRETAKLDTLVEKKRALIEKLKEKRAALISRTVTRGLPPDAARAAGLNPHPKLKPSGVEWIGDVPEHWRVKAVKHVATIGNGSTPHRDNAEYWEDGSYPWLNSSVVNQIRVTAAEQFVTDTALAQCHLPRISPPAVLVGITGEGKTRGMATTLCIEATINQHMAYIKPKDTLADVGYLHRVFERAYFYLRNESDGGGSTKGAITCEQIANLKLPLPSIEEQRAIANYLDHETTKIDRLTEKIEAAIERLREYRTALITAAVTGKIDVRGTAA